MNIHPILVHFPVAFLSIYGLMELVRIKYITSTAYWFYIKASMIIIGTAGAGAAYLSGEEAVELIGESQLIELHSKFAKASVIISGSIAIIYAIAWLSRLEMFNRLENYLKLDELRLYVALKKLLNYLVESFVMVLPALAGLGCITITGALGGAIVYGPDIDPVVRFIYDLVM